MKAQYLLFILFISISTFLLSQENCAEEHIPNATAIPNATDPCNHNFEGAMGRYLDCVCEKNKRDKQKREEEKKKKEENKSKKEEEEGDEESEDEATDEVKFEYRKSPCTYLESAQNRLTNTTDPEQRKELQKRINELKVSCDRAQERSTYSSERRLSGSSTASSNNTKQQQQLESNRKLEEAKRQAMKEQEARRIELNQSINRLNNTLNHYVAEYERIERERKQKAEAARRYQQNIEKRKKEGYARDKQTYSKEYYSFVQKFDEKNDGTNGVYPLSVAIEKANIGDIVYFTSVGLAGALPSNFAGGSWEEYDLEGFGNQNYTVTYFLNLRKVKVSELMKRNADMLEQYYLSKNCTGCDGEERFEKQSLWASTEPHKIYDKLNATFNSGLKHAFVYVNDHKKFDVVIDDKNLQYKLKSVKEENLVFTQLTDLADKIKTGTGSFRVENSVYFYNNGKYIAFIYDEPYDNNKIPAKPIREFCNTTNLNAMDVLDTDYPRVSCGLNLWGVKGPLCKTQYRTGQMELNFTAARYYVLNYVYINKTHYALHIRDDYFAEKNLLGNIRSDRSEYQANRLSSGNQFLNVYDFNKLPVFEIEIGEFRFDGRSLSKESRKNIMITVGNYLLGSFEKIRKSGNDYYAVYKRKGLYTGWIAVPPYRTNGDLHYWQNLEPHNIKSFSTVDELSYESWINDFNITIPNQNSGYPIRIGQSTGEFDLLYRLVSNDELLFLGQDLKVGF